MGLLDFPEDPQKQALMMAALGLLGGAPQGRKSFGADLSHAGLLAMQGLQQGRAFQMKQQEEAQQKQLRDMQLQQMQRDAATQQGILGAANKAYAPAQTTQPDPYEFDQMGQDTPQPQPFTRPAGGGDAEFMKSLMTLDPMKGFALRQTLAKETPFSKVDPKDFTPESIKAFMLSGGHDFTLLRPRVKQEAVNKGGSTVFVDPYAPPASVAHDLSPADSQRIPIERAQLGVSLAKARDEGVQGLPGVPGAGQFITGGAPGAAPISTPTMPPQAATLKVLPAGPAGQPPANPLLAQTVPGLSPKQQREIAEANAKSLPGDMNAYQSATAGLDGLRAAAQELRQAPGVAGMTGTLGALPNAPGSNASNAAAKLEVLKSKVAFNALQAMREASKTGGALGSVSDKEMSYLENSIAALNTKQSTAEFKAQLQKVEAYADNLQRRMTSVMKQRYGDAFSRAQSGGGAADPLGIL